MNRARRAGLTALIVVAMATVAPGIGGLPALAAAVAWPTSTLVLSEVQTGGASASDEFVEVANQGSMSVDLLGLELVYATSSGSTVTRKATWGTSTVLAPGQRLLVANTAGVYAAGADAIYSGGFAATGGALALRIVGGAVVDSIGWGDATSGFVEGSAAGAPPAGSSLERRPGAALGNTIDTNDNAPDWFVQGTPSPQGLTAPPVPGPGGTPTPTPSATPSPPVPTPTPTPDADGEPDAGADPEPTPEPTRRRPTPARRRPRTDADSQHPRRPAPRRHPADPVAASASPTPSPTPAPTPVADCQRPCAC